jgi:hypothetical protein
MPFDKEQETQPEIDLDAAQADISSELFGQGDDEDEKSEEASAEGEQGAVSATVEGVETPPAPQSKKPEDGEAPSGDENSTEVQEVGAPKTWTKEALEKWATVDPVVQSEVLKREEDFLRGITQYKAAADVGTRYSNVAQPYAAQLAAHNIDPVQLFQSFAANHYLLSFGQPQQKLELAATMLNNYGIDLNALNQFMGDRATEAPDPEILALRKEIQELRGGIQTTQQVQLSTARESIVSGIEAFASDPAHPYFDEVADHISELIGNGSVQSLEDAYNTAVYANPVTRQKEIDRLIADKNSTTAAQEQARLDKIAESTAANVTADPQNRDGTEPVGTIDETLEKTMRAIQARG